MIMTTQEKGGYQLRPEAGDRCGMRHLTLWPSRGLSSWRTVHVPGHSGSQPWSFACLSWLLRDSYLMSILSLLSMPSFFHLGLPALLSAWRVPAPGVSRVPASVHWDLGSLSQPPGDFAGHTVAPLPPTLLSPVSLSYCFSNSCHYLKLSLLFFPTGFILSPLLELHEGRNFVPRAWP